jgi:hypothetical protein
MPLNASLSSRSIKIRQALPSLQPGSQTILQDDFVSNQEKCYERDTAEPSYATISFYSAAKRLSLDPHEYHVLPM